MLNVSDYERYIKFVIGKDATFCGVWMDDQKHKPVGGSGKGIHDTVNAHLQWYIDLVEEPRKAGMSNINTCDYASLHITLNHLPYGAPRKTTSFDDCRVLCVDLDEEISNIEISRMMYKEKPHMVIESSPKRYHLYWKVAPQFQCRDWKRAWQTSQAVLAHYFKADPNLSSLSHLIRVPGFPRHTKDGKLFTPKIIHEELYPKPLTYANMADWIPDFADLVKEVEDLRKKHNKKISEEVLKHAKLMKIDALEAGGREPGAKRWTLPKERLINTGERNNTLFQYVYHYCLHAKPSLEEAVAYANQLTQMFRDPYPESEAITTIESAYNRAKDMLDLRRKKMHMILTAVKSLDDDT